MAQKNPLWDLIQEYMDDPKHRYRVVAADLSRETGVSEQVLSKWKARPVLPNPLHLVAFSVGTGIPYESLLKAVLEGRGYLPVGGDTRIVLSKGFAKGLAAEGHTMIDSAREAEVRLQEKSVATKAALLEELSAGAIGATVRLHATLSLAEGRLTDQDRLEIEAMIDQAENDPTSRVGRYAVATTARTATADALNKYLPRDEGPEVETAHDGESGQGKVS